MMIWDPFSTLKEIISVIVPRVACNMTAPVVVGVTVNVAVPATADTDLSPDRLAVPETADSATDRTASGPVVTGVSASSWSVTVIVRAKPNCMVDDPPVTPSCVAACEIVTAPLPPRVAPTNVPERALGVT